MKVFTSREFNQDVSNAKRAARLEPVFVTDRGKPTHVLIGIDAFRAMSTPADGIVDLLAAQGLPDLELDPARPGEPWARG